MHAEYDSSPRTIEDLCERLEALCEGFVEAHAAEIDHDPDAFPCCVKCGEMECIAAPRWPSRNAPLTESQRAALQATLHHGHPTSAAEREALEGILVAHGEQRGGAPERRPGAQYFKNPLWPGRELQATANLCATRTIASRNPRAPYAAVRCRCAEQLCRTKRGNGLEIAVFQCAQERRRGKDCSVGISYDSDDNLHAFVVYADGTVKDPRESLIAKQACGCGGEHK